MLLLARWFTLPAKHQSKVFYFKKKSLLLVHILGIYHPPCHKHCYLPCVLLLCNIKPKERYRDSWGGGKTRKFIRDQLMIKHFELLCKQVYQHQG